MGGEEKPIKMRPSKTAYLHLLLNLKFLKAFSLQNRIEHKFKVKQKVTATKDASAHHYSQLTG